VSAQGAGKLRLREWCQNCASDGVNVSQIDPGMVRSPFSDDFTSGSGKNPETVIAPT